MEIIITNAQKKIRLNKKEIESTAKKVLKVLRLPSNSVLSLSFVSKRKIIELNRRYFKKKTRKIASIND